MQKKYDCSLLDNKLSIEDTFLKNKIELNEKLIQERNEEIEKIFKDIKLVNEIFRDLGKITNEQSNLIVSMEKNIDTTVKTTEETIEILKIVKSNNNNFFSIENKYILLGIFGISINTPVALLFGTKALLLSGIGTIGLGAISTLFKKKI